MPLFFDLTTHNLPLTVDSIGNRWTQESVRRPNGYRHYHWLQTEAGAGEAVIDNVRLPLQEKSGVLIAPFVPHSYHANQDGWTTSFVTFSGTLATEISKIVGYERFIPITDDTDFSFQNWIDSTISLHEMQQIDPIELSVSCYRFFTSINQLRDYRDFLINPLYQKYVAPIIKEIETNYSLDISIRGLADTVYISPQYLSRLFRRFLGCGPCQYLTSYRMSKAKELLANRHDLSIHQISFLTGYHDTSYFIATFKSTTNYTPLEFRQLYH